MCAMAKLYFLDSMQKSLKLHVVTIITTVGLSVMSYVVYWREGNGLNLCLHAIACLCLNLLMLIISLLFCCSCSSVCVPHI